MRKMDQRRLLAIELWARRTRALVGDSSRMYRVTVSILVWPGVEGKSIPTSSEERGLASRCGMGYPEGPTGQAQFWSLTALLKLRRQVRWLWPLQLSREQEVTLREEAFSGPSLPVDSKVFLDSGASLSHRGSLQCVCGPILFHI